jgi:hypothetical protein
MSFELSKFQSGAIKQTSNMTMHEPQIRIVNHDHIAVITWFGTHIIVHRLKRSNIKKHFQAQDSTSCSHRKLGKDTYPDWTKHFQAQQISKKDHWGIDHHLH